MNLQNKTIGEIVAQDYRAASVFKRHGIDFCCGGKRNVVDACAEKGVDFTRIAQELTELNQQSSTLQMNYKDWTADFLADYVVNRHHTYIRKVLPEITAYAEKVAKVHGKRHPETVEIFYNWKALSIDLESHLLKEENFLFPFIKKLAQANGDEPIRAPFGTVEHPVQMMEMEHDDAGELMRNIRELSSDFTPPADACTTYRVLFQMLEEFETDLHEHVHIENNILFPKALQLENN